MAYVAPQSDIEKQLAQIWAEVFPSSKSASTTISLILGGHSLSATQLVSAGYRTLSKLEIPLRSLISISHRDGLAAVITEHLEKRAQ